MDNGRKGCLHVVWCSELFNLDKSAIDLVAHGGNNVIARDKIFFCDESFCPDLSVHFVALLQVLADVVFLFSNASKLLASVDIHASL